MGRAVIVVSSELPEVIRVSDRVPVMREGRISATFGPGEITEANIARTAIPASRQRPAMTNLAQTPLHSRIKFREAGSH